MAIPTFKAAGTFTAGTGAITPPFPAAPNAPVAGDIALLVCESENQPISLSSAQGFVELGNQATQSAGTAAVNPASRLAVYWKRCVGGDTAPTVADSGDHTTGRIYLFSGVKTSGDPWNVLASGNDGGANDTTGVIPGATTTVANCLIILISTSSYNGTSTAQFSAWANGDLSSIVEGGDNTNTAGLGGGHGLATGEKATAGSYGNTTVTLAQTSYKGAISIALEPTIGTPQSQTVTDITGLVDSVAKKQAIYKTVSDQTGLLDSALATRATGQTVNDSTGLLESVITSLISTQAVTDPLGLTDSISKVWTAYNSVSDVSGLVDSVIAVHVPVRGGGAVPDSSFYHYYHKKKPETSSLAPLAPKVNEEVWKAKPQLPLDERIKKFLKRRSE